MGSRPRMDSPTSFDDDDEHFFSSYVAEQAQLGAVDPLELDESQPPSPEQLARLARFRRAVAWGVSALALFSLLVLEVHGSERGPVAERRLVAHYGAAIAARAPAPLAAIRPAASTPDAAISPAASAPVTQTLIASIGIASALASDPAQADVTELGYRSDVNHTDGFIALFTPMCLRPGAFDSVVRFSDVRR
ncbi:MAG: hypothetical protein ABW061_09375 [Polyangiaceae bacterium]